MGFLFGVGEVAMRFAAFSLLCLTACSTAARNDFMADGWHDDFETRLKAQALLQTFNADLLSHPSATLTLERCSGTLKKSTR